VPEVRVRRRSTFPAGLVEASRTQEKKTTHGQISTGNDRTQRVEIPWRGLMIITRVDTHRTSTQSVPETFCGIAPVSYPRRQIQSVSWRMGGSEWARHWAVPTSGVRTSATAVYYFVANSEATEQGNVSIAWIRKEQPRRFLVPGREPWVEGGRTARCFFC